MDQSKTKLTASPSKITTIAKKEEEEESEEEQDVVPKRNPDTICKNEAFVQSLRSRSMG